MSFCELLFQRASTKKIQLGMFNDVGLVQSGLYHFIKNQLVIAMI
jgi:hypothetical protein